MNSNVVSQPHKITPFKNKLTYCEVSYEKGGLILVHVLCPFQGIRSKEPQVVARQCLGLVEFQISLALKHGEVTPLSS